MTTAEMRVLDDLTAETRASITAAILAAARYLKDGEYNLTQVLAEALEIERAVSRRRPWSPLPPGPRGDQE